MASFSCKVATLSFISWPIENSSWTCYSQRSHVFSCINNCCVSRKLFEHEAAWPSFKHLLTDTGRVNGIKQMYVIVILAYFTWSNLKSLWKHCWNIKLSFNTRFLHTKMASASNFRTQWSHNVTEFMAHFRYCQVKNHVQTACEPHDLNIFCSFSNFFKQLLA